MYPRNSATPPRIAIGAVIQISDGAVQSSGVSVVVRAEGGSETAGGGTVSYGGSSNVVYYAPTQAETNYTAFVVTAYKTGCIPVSKTVITTESATAGRAYLAAGDVSGNLPANMTQISGDSTAADNLEAAADGTGYNLGGGQVVAASVTDKTGFALTAAYDAAKSAASQASVDVIDGIVDAILEDTGTTIPATLATIDTNVDSILTDTGTDIPTSIAAIDADVQTLLTNLATADGKLDSILEDTGTTLPATLSALQTSVTTIDDLLDTEVAAIKSVVDAILVDTAEIGAAGAGLTAVPWNASWDAEVQSECTDALNAYDPPTNAEMEARTLTAASYATPTNITSASGVTLTSAYDFAKGTVAMTESYNADGSAPTPAQALFVIMQTLTEGAISGTTWTIKKLDGSTTALTITLNDADAPTSKTRAS